jgi:hypothetical protein
MYKPEFTHPYPCPTCDGAEYDKQVAEGKITPPNKVEYIGYWSLIEGHLIQNIEVIQSTLPYLPMIYSC